jgi:hypothetical protein
LIFVASHGEILRGFALSNSHAAFYFMAWEEDLIRLAPMKNHRHRPLLLAALALVVVWAATWAAFHFSGNARMTAEKIRQYTLSIDLAALSQADRDKAISALADRVNALAFDERLKWRRSEEWKKWFAAMTEEERRKFIAATLPAGFRQTLEAFSQLPPDQRKKFIDDSVQRLKEDGAAGINKSVGDYGPNGPPPLSPELQDQVRSLGMQQLFTDGSAETRAELAPLLEEMQRQTGGSRR